MNQSDFYKMQKLNFDRQKHRGYWNIGFCPSASSPSRSVRRRGGRPVSERFGPGLTSLNITDGDIRPSVPAFKHSSRCRRRNLGMRNVFQNEDDSPLLVSSIDGISSWRRTPGALTELNNPRLAPDLPVFLIKSRNSPARACDPSDPYSSIRRKIKRVSNKCLRNIQRKKPERREKSSLEDNFDLESLDNKLREISEKCSKLKSVAEVSLPEQDLRVSETKADIEQNESCSDDEDSGILAGGSDDLSQSSDSSGGERMTRKLSTASRASRASSLDRREILEKYISHHHNHSLRLYTGTGDTATTTTINTSRRNLRLVNLIGVSDKTIGVSLAKVPLASIKCDGYKVVEIQDDGWAQRSGVLTVGDEIVNIDGRRLRGLGLDKARQILSQCSRTAEAVVARTEEEVGEVREREEKIVLSGGGGRSGGVFSTVISVRERDEDRSCVTAVDTPHTTRHCLQSSSQSARPLLSPSILSFTFQKGPGHPPLGFSVVGGADSAKGSLGIFVKTVMPEGQAALSLSEGDQILSVNGQSLQGLSHSEAISVFKVIRSGQVSLQVVRRPAPRLARAIISAVTTED